MRVPGLSEMRARALQALHLRDFVVIKGDLGGRRCWPAATDCWATAAGAAVPIAYLFMEYINTN